MTRRLKLSVLGLTVLALMAFAPSAFASTINKNGSNVTWTAAGGIANNVTISDPDADTVVISTANDPVTAVTGGQAANCTTGDAGVTYTCTNTTGGQVTANPGDNNDTVDGSTLDFHRIVIQGDNGDDTLTGGSLNDDIRGQAGDDTIVGGAGDDNRLDGGFGNDHVSGGDGNDSQIRGGEGNDVLDGGAGNDNLSDDRGGFDTLTGGDGDDSLSGGDDNDSLDGGAGNDYLEGDDGADNVSGGAGDDYIYEYNDGQPDNTSGGDGQDTIEYDSDGNTNDVLNISLDGQANDGDVPGPGSSTDDDSHNNIGSDFEIFDIYSNAPTNVTGNAGPNTVNSYQQSNDTVDMGAGADAVFTGDGSDTVNAVDGYPDTINCGAGTDTANVDQYDTTFNCETVNVRQVPSAFTAAEDAPPSVSWVTPTIGSHAIPSGSATRLEVAAADDHGVTKVVFQVGQRVICTVTAAPYVCNYQPIGQDIGRNTLVAVATDTVGQTAAAFNEVVVPRFAARSLTYKVTPKRDATAPYKFTTTGKLNLPATVRAAEGCKGGLVSVQFRAGKKTISNRRVGLQKNCTFKSAVTFKIPSRLHPKSLNVLVRFLGNGVMNPRKAKAGKVRTA